MANPQHAILTNLTKYQWYTHFSRTEGADLATIKATLRDVRTAGAQTGVTTPINVCLLFGPTLLADLTDDLPADFEPYPGYRSPDGKEAKATQEELLLWIHSDEKDLVLETQFTFRNAVAGHMIVARETPTFIYRNSLDLTGFIDGTGNPTPRSTRPGDCPRRKGGGRLVLYRATLGARPLVLLGPFARRPGEHVRAHQDRLDSARDPGPGRISAMSSYTRARPATTPNPTAARWSVARRRTRSMTAPSACTSWAFAASKHLCGNAWKRSTE